MNIKELIESTGKVNHRGQNNTFSKKFGAIYAFNKEINIAQGGNAIIVSMMIGGVTDMIKVGGKKRPVAYHKVALALRVDKESRKEYSPKALVQVLRKNHTKFKDEKEWPNWLVLKEAVENPTSYFENATLFKVAKKDEYIVLTNNIPEDSEVQVWCSCSDYYWTFQYYNMQTRNENGSCLNLYGGSYYPKSYNHLSEKGRKSRVPLRNPGRHPGMCKHLMLLTALLLKDEVITDPKNGFKQYFEANYSEFIEGKEQDRVDRGTFEKMQKEYNKDHKVLNTHRNTRHYMAGNKVERKFNYKTMTHTTKVKSKFDPFTGTFKKESKGKKKKK